MSEKKNQTVSVITSTRTEAPVKTKRGRRSNLISGSDDISYESIAGILRSLRHSKGMRQSLVAESLGITASAYSHYECGDRFPDLAALVRISNLYSINISYLIFVTCISSVRSYGMTSEDVFRAYSHNKLLLAEDARLLSQCNRLSDDSKENLMLFLSAAMDCDDNYRDS